MCRLVLVIVMLAAIAAGAAAQTGVQERSRRGQARGAGATYQDWAGAIEAANSTTANLTTLIAAVQAAGLAGALNSTMAWTVIAPTNSGIASRLKEELNLTAAQLLAPENNATLLEVLSYHVIPGAALLSSDLKNGQNLTTALAGAAPLRVRLEAGKKPRFVGATNTATLQVADIRVGASVVHVVNDLLLPAGVGKGTGKNGGGSLDTSNSTRPTRGRNSTAQQD